MSFKASSNPGLVTVEPSYLPHITSFGLSDVSVLIHNHTITYHKLIYKIIYYQPVVFLNFFCSCKVHSANAWEKADLGDEDRKKKFLRLMGAGKVIII